MRFSRRDLISGGSLAAVAILGGCGRSDQAVAAIPEDKFPIRRTEAEWRTRLTDQQFYILRKAGTERPYSSPLDKEKRRGTFVCAADGNRLFSSATKFDSRTGWPSFYRPLDGAVATKQDRTLGMVRTEVLCADCGGHLGHVFTDGPKPTGLRYCMNGAAMKFVPA